MPGALDLIARGAAAVGSHLAKPPESEEAGLRAKQSNIKEYMDSFAKAMKPPEKPAAVKTPDVDKVKPKARYGDKPGEKRPEDLTPSATPGIVPFVGNTEGMPGRVPSYKDGIARVPKTGPAMLHEGEAVIPKEKNPVNKDMMSLVPGNAETPKKEISHMVHRKDKKTGKHVIEHHHTSPMHHPVEHHHLPDMGAVHDHMEEHMGTPNPGEAEADGGQHGIPEGTPGMPPAPAPAAPAAPAPMGA